MPKPVSEKPGYFGPYGGRYAPETLMAPLEELAKGYDKDPDVLRTMKSLIDTEIVRMRG